MARTLLIFTAVAVAQLHGAGLEHRTNQIRVRLYDYAGASPGTLSRAKAVADQVFALAGVGLSWADCSADPNAPGDAACLLPVTTSDLQLRIISKEMAKRTPVSRHCLGYAVIGGEFSSIASVFFHRALDLESANFGDLSAILGVMMAHEIGHLLLAERSHSRQGIMRAVWYEQDMKTMAKGWLWFTPAEAALLNVNVQRRQRH